LPSVIPNEAERNPGRWNPGRAKTATSADQSKSNQIRLNQSKSGHLPIRLPSIRLLIPDARARTTGRRTTFRAHRRDAPIRVNPTKSGQIKVDQAKFGHPNG
jgi:hypothetical protein